MDEDNNGEINAEEFVSRSPSGDARTRWVFLFGMEVVSAGSCSTQKEFLFCF